MTVTREREIQRHIEAIKEWIEEACEDNPDVDPSDVEGDILISYISCEIPMGEANPIAKSIRRRFGR